MAVDQRVACRMVLEDLRWSYSIWPESNGTPKPARAAIKSDAAIRAEVIDELRMERALSAHYGVQLDTKSLQGELNRMAVGSNAPERLREEFAALGNDPRRIAECLARPLLVERRLREGYAYDERKHGALRVAATTALASGASNTAIAESGGTEVLVTVRLDTGGAFSRNDEARDQILLDPAAFAAERARLEGARVAKSRRKFPWPLLESDAAFVEESVQNEDKDHFQLRRRIWPKKSFDDWWQSERSAHGPAVPNAEMALTLPAISGRKTQGKEAQADSWRTPAVPSARYNHSAVWTGNMMLIWGGTSGGGSRYEPSTDTWSPISSNGAPLTQLGQSVIWSGREMLVWGGVKEPDAGGRYDPVNDSWVEINSIGGPSARRSHSAVWASGEMIIWGGMSGSGQLMNSGGRFNPNTGQWLPILSGGPAPRFGHSAIWTGQHMIVWGGNAPGGRFDPVNSVWTEISTLNSPSARSSSSVVWTGSEMIVWGGNDQNAALDTGARYNPDTDTWTPTGGSPPSPRSGHTTVWTGSELIVWGGGSGVGPTSPGGRYNPTTDAWIPINFSGVPLTEDGTAIWTGSEMIVWGGIGDAGITDAGGRYNVQSDSWVATPSSRVLNVGRSFGTAIWTGNEMIVWGGDFPYSANGVRYAPANDTWTVTSTVGAPAGRLEHSAVWTGTEMIVWGGGYPELNTGGRYNPLTDTWSSTTLSAAPSPRVRHTAVWTGTEMIVWGGGLPTTRSGARYRPASDSWVSMEIFLAPSSRYSHTAVWTGTEMIVFGGWPLTNDHAYYDPTMNRWTFMPTTNAPATRIGHSAVWTGAEMIVWGGDLGSNNTMTNTGGRYNPLLNQWRDVAMSDAPTARDYHSAIWTGTEMIIWGGRFEGNTGARYQPNSDSWIATNRIAAPSGRYFHHSIWTGQEMLVFGGCCPGEFGIYYPYSRDLIFVGGFE